MDAASVAEAASALAPAPASYGQYAEAAAQPPAVLSNKDICGLKTAGLRAALGARGLVQSGNKPALLERLLAAEDARRSGRAPHPHRSGSNDHFRRRKKRPMVWPPRCSRPWRRS